ncbi:MAG TPA: hypothetical protein PKW28_07690 [Turneriella sp.]|nr:hypothetical protein [Turneriella sp.]HNA80651.1 hypothetical protein [Turneriella sp.]HNE18921.1 hypothetical protein [Turneriella sp.]HNJ65759.1 hypothetical protein [Turneriella sp.]HNL54575.1 hypothetical protein [Turneriella sp.]
MNKEDIAESIKELLVSETDMSYLAELPEKPLQQLYADLQTYMKRLDENQKPVFKAIAISTSFIPNFIIAKLAHDYFTPYIVAQVCEYMDPKAAAKIGKSLRVDYMGQVAVNGDPKVTARIGDCMEVDIVVNVVREMVKRSFFLKLGELADLLNENHLKNVMLKINDNNAIFQVGLHMQDEGKIIRLSKAWPAATRTYVVAELQKINHPLASKL